MVTGSLLCKKNTISRPSVVLGGDMDKGMLNRHVFPLDQLINFFSLNVCQLGLFLLHKTNFMLFVGIDLNINL